MNHEERDSQLSAMFDDELPAGECELLARRLARDPALQERWGRYAAIGACLKGQAGVRLPGQDSVADHVRIALGGEPVHGVPEPEQAGTELTRSVTPRWLMPLGLTASAAAVAAFAIVWMRGQSPGLVAQAPAKPAAVPTQVTQPVVPAPMTAPALLAQADAPSLLQPAADAQADSAPRNRSRERDSYVVPAPSLNSPAVLLPTRDANYQGSPAQYPGPVH